MIIGRPNNAIACALARKTLTGEQPVMSGDSVRRGSIVLGALVSCIVVLGLFLDIGN